MVRAIVAKWDGDYVLRVPKRYIEDNHLKIGEAVAIAEPLILQQNAVAALVRHGKDRGSLQAANNPERVPQQLHRGEAGREAGRGPTKR